MSMNSRLMLFGLALVAAEIGPSTSGAAAAGAAPSIYDFPLKDIDGNDRSLAEYRGKVILVVNVASKCGYTYQYRGLEAVYEKYKDRGLVVAGFPSNDFLGQEPGTNAEIKEFCGLTYGVAFPMFEKIKVKGRDIHPLYKYLTSKETDGAFSGAITWNFNKFLIGRDGRTLARFGSKDEPDGEAMVRAIEAALKG